MKILKNLFLIVIPFFIIFGGLFLGHILEETKSTAVCFFMAFYFVMLFVIGRALRKLKELDADIFSDVTAFFIGFQIFGVIFFVYSLVNDSDLPETIMVSSVVGFFALVVMKVLKVSGQGSFLLGIPKNQDDKK